MVQIEEPEPRRSGTSSSSGDEELERIRDAVAREQAVELSHPGSRVVVAEIDPVVTKAALSHYLSVQEAQIAGIHEALCEFGRGEGVAHERVREWVESWDTDVERSAPTA